jgi:hypothetical protein
LGRTLDVRQGRARIVTGALEDGMVELAARAALDEARERRLSV